IPINQSSFFEISLMSREDDFFTSSIIREVLETFFNALALATSIRLSFNFFVCSGVSFIFFNQYDRVDLGMWIRFSISEYEIPRLRISIAMFCLYFSKYGPIKFTCSYAWTTLIITTHILSM